jgi:hypothetical protein
MLVEVQGERVILGGEDVTVVRGNLAHQHASSEREPSALERT